MALVYRRAQVKDLQQVVALCMEVEEQHEKYWPLRWERRGGLAEGYLGWLTRRVEDPRMLVQVAVDQGVADQEVVAGMVIVTIEKEVPIYTYSEYAYVQDIAVRREYGRQGVAGKLLAEAGLWAKGQGLNQLRLMVANQNPEARGAFLKAGFRATYQEMVLPVGE